jgi:hypothetical protein
MSAINLHREFEKIIDARLDKESETIGWAMTLVNVQQGANPSDQAIAVLISMFTPSPVMGQTLSMQLTVLDPFMALRDGPEEGVPALLGGLNQGIEGLKQYRSEALRTAVPGNGQGEVQPGIIDIPRSPGP